MGKDAYPVFGSKGPRAYSPWKLLERGPFAVRHCYRVRSSRHDGRTGKEIAPRTSTRCPRIFQQFSFSDFDERPKRRGGILVLLITQAQTGLALKDRACYYSEINSGRSG